MITIVIIGCNFGLHSGDIDMLTVKNGDSKRYAGLPALSSTACHHPDSYIRSLGYYLLTGRKGAHLYQDGHSQLIVCEHPHIEDRLLVFPEINGTGALTVKVLNDIHVPSGGIQLARYTDQDLARLTLAARNLTASKKIITQEIEEKILDWKYPARILDTATTAALQGKAFDKLRNKINKIATHIDILPLRSKEGHRAIRASLMFWVGSMIYGEKETGHDLIGFYETLLQAVQQYPDLFDGLVFLAGGEPAGFTVWDAPINNAVNAMASLSRTSVKGLSEYQTVAACRTLIAQNVHSYNMGGSETGGLDQYKMKFRPARSIMLRSYEVTLRNPLSDGLSALALPSLSSPHLSLKR